MSPDSLSTAYQRLEQLHAGMLELQTSDARAQYERFFLAALTGYLSSFAGVEKTGYSEQAIAAEAGDLADAALAEFWRRAPR